MIVWNKVTVVLVVVYIAVGMPLEEVVKDEDLLLAKTLMGFNFCPSCSSPLLPKFEEVRINLLTKNLSSLTSIVFQITLMLL